MTITRPDDEPKAGERAGETAFRAADRPYRRRLTRMAVAALVVLLLAELGARAAGTVLPDPQVFYDAVPQAKDAQLRRLAAAGGADVVVTGPSSTLFGVDPDALSEHLRTDTNEVSVYNAGITAGVPAITADWLRRYVLPRARPDTVVWILSSADLNDGVRIAAVDSYSSSPAGRSDLWARVDRRASQLSALVRHRRQLRSPKALIAAARGRPSPAEAWEKRLTPNGLATYQQLPLNELARRQVSSLLQGFKVGGANAELVRQAVERMKREGIRVVLAEAPLPDRTERLHPRGELDVQAFRDVLQRVAEQAGVAMIPLPDALRDDALYQDYSHLNRQGAEQYTALLGRELR